MSPFLHHPLILNPQHSACLSLCILRSWWKPASCSARGGKPASCSARGSIFIDASATRLVAEASVKLVDGICLKLAGRRVEYSHSSSVSEYSRHFCVCNTNCGSFFLFVGKTGNAHTHGVARRRTNTLPVENRRGIDAPSCVPSGFSLPLSFKTFRCAGSTDSGPLVPGFITPGELKPFLHAGLPQPTLFPLISSYLPVGKFLELSQFIARLWKSKLTPWSIPPPRVHVLFRGLCGGKVRHNKQTPIRHP